MRILAILIILIHSTNIAVAEDSPIALEKGAPSPFSGMLFSHEHEQKLRLINEKLKVSEDMIELQKRLLEINKAQFDIYEKRVDNYTQNLDILAKRVTEQKDSNIWSNMGFFAFGAILTGFIAYGVAQSNR